MNHDLTSSLAEVLIRGALLLPVCLLVAVLLHRGSASLLRRFWRCTFLALLMATGLTFAPPLVEFQTNKLVPSIAAPEAVAPVALVPNDAVPGSPSAPLEDVLGLTRPPAAVPLAAPKPVESPVSNQTPHSSFPFSLPLLLGLFWLAGAVFLAARKLLGTIGVIRLRRAACPVDHPDWHRDLGLLRDSCGVRQKVQLRHHLALRSPIVTGVRKPMIVLPADYAKYSPDDRRAVLLHELAHVRHRDALFRWIAVLARILHWPNPLVWFAEGSLRLAEERASDDAVLLGGVAAPKYAELLARLAKGGAPLIGDLGTMGESAMAQPKTLLPRVHALLRPCQSRRQPGHATSLTLATTALAVALLAGGSAFVKADPQDQSPAPPSTAKDNPAPAPGHSGIEAKLRSIVLPLADFNEATLDEVLEFIRVRSRQHDPEKRGINIISTVPKLTSELQEGPNKDLDWVKNLSNTITLRLEQVPISALLDFICNITGTSYRTSEFAVTIFTGQSHDLVTKNLRIPAEIFEAVLEAVAGGGGGDPNPFGPAGDPFAQPSLPSAIDWLQQQGVNFPPGASAFYTKAAGTLHIRNLPTEIEFAERIIDSLNERPSLKAMRQADAKRLAALKRALREITIPDINFEDATLVEALNYIRTRAKELHPQKDQPDPIQFVFNVPSETLAAKAVSLKLQQVPVGAAIKHITELAGTRSVVTSYGIEIVPWERVDEPLLLATFRLSPENMKRIRESIDGGSTSYSPIAVLRSVGIEFPPGAGAFWNSKTGDLIVRNTIGNLSHIETFLEGLEPLTRE